MQLTIFSILLPVLFILAFVKPKTTVYLLIISLTLQVSSVFNIGEYSMQIYRFITVVLSLVFLLKIIKNGFILRLQSVYVKSIFVIGVLFAFYSLVISLLAPLIFEGYLVFPPELGIDFSAIYGASPLVFNVYNVAFPIYIILYILTLGYIGSLKWEEEDIINLKKSLDVSLLVVIITSISQILTYSFGIFDVTKIFYTITTREFKYSFIADFLPLPRIQATYLEPSMLSPFLIGFYSMYLYNMINKRILEIKYLFIFVILFVITLFTTSTTAYVSLLLITLIILFYANTFSLIRSNIVVKLNLIRNLLYITLTLIMFFFIVSFVLNLNDIFKIIVYYLSGILGFT